MKTQARRRIARADRLGDGADAGCERAWRSRFAVAATLLTAHQRIVLALLTLGRIAVGFCDLAVAGAMYLLFLLLQQHAPAHPPRWLPVATLPVALLTSMLVLVRMGTDLLSLRAVALQLQKLHAHLLLRLTEGYQQLSWKCFVESNRSEMSNYALNTTREAAEFYQRCMDLTAAIVITLAMTAAILYQSIVAAGAFALALGGFYALHRTLVRDRVQRAAARREQALHMLQHDFADALASGKEVRTYGNHSFFQDRIRRQMRNLAASNVRILSLPRILGSLADQGAVLLFLGIITAVELRQGDMRQVLSLLAFYFVLSRRLIPMVSQMAAAAGQIESSFENVRIVVAELDRCHRHRAGVITGPPPERGWAMELEGVSFGYPGQDLILRNICLRVRDGELIVVHGRSGSGKSTFLNLLAGLIRPVAGRIRMDRVSVAYVPQEIALLDDSIRTNLLFGLKEKSDAELTAALAAARLSDFVLAHACGLDARAGDNGALWSGGQRQRLGIARAVLRGARVLLLDEATSALDADNEWLVLHALRAAGKAMVLVTHRSLPPGLAHRTFRLEEGHLIELQAAGAGSL